MHRNTSINRYFNDLAARHQPALRFAGSSKQDWQNWRNELHKAVVASLGKMPPKVPLKAEVLAEWREDGLLKQRLVLDVEDGLSAYAYLFRPEGAKGKLPGLLACHGHGAFGKEAIMGNRSSAELARNIAEHNYDYGLQMAKAGYAVVAIDWRGFGERDDRRKPHFHDIFWNRDPCNVHYIRATMLGMTVLGMDVHDGQCALDLLCSQDFVDERRIGALGLSFGGTMTTWMSIADERIKTADIICYSDRFEQFAFRTANTCGSQLTPGLFALCDLPDLQGLIAPRPLLIEIGVHDECFKVDSAMSCYRELEKIYRAAGAADKLELDLFEGGHGFSGHKAFEFFARHLKE